MWTTCSIEFNRVSPIGFIDIFLVKQWDRWPQPTRLQLDWQVNERECKFMQKEESSKQPEESEDVRVDCTVKTWGLMPFGDHFSQEFFLASRCARLCFANSQKALCAMPIFMKLQVHHVASIDCRTDLIQNSRSVKMESSWARNDWRDPGRQDCPAFHSPVSVGAIEIPSSQSRKKSHWNTTRSDVPMFRPAKWASCLRRPSVLLPSVQNGSSVSPARSLAERNSKCFASLFHKFILSLSNSQRSEGNGKPVPGSGGSPTADGRRPTSMSLRQNWRQFVRTHSLCTC